MIPKNVSPAGLTELRNLSCTPLFSKVLESFVLDRLKSETALSSNQYGGIKGCSTEYFLLETWDKVMDALDDGESAANLVSIDFEKAFNRMDHTQCLIALSDLGASEEAIDWTAAFLYRRTMSVKINEARSVPRTVPGGSPQGSILGNFLFCATTNCFAEMDSPVLNSSWSTSDSESELPLNTESATIQRVVTSPPMVASTPTSRGQFAHFEPPQCLLDLSGDFQSDEEDSFRFFQDQKRKPL